MHLLTSFPDAGSVTRTSASSLYFDSTEEKERREKLSKNPSRSLFPLNSSRQDFFAHLSCRWASMRRESVGRQYTSGPGRMRLSAELSRGANQHQEDAGINYLKKSLTNQQPEEAGLPLLEIEPSREKGPVFLKEKQIPLPRSLGEMIECP